MGSNPIPLQQHMSLDSFILYFLSTLLVFSSLLVICVSNTVYSVLFLILSFITSAGILFLLDCEFMALIFVVIYVGAIAILFLFVVMMLDIKITDSFKDVLKYFPISIFFCVIFLGELSLILVDYFKSNPYKHNFEFNDHYNWYAKIDSLTDIESLGQVLYTHYIYHFLIAGVILLIGVVGSVILTVNFETNHVKVQNTFRQVSR